MSESEQKYLIKVTRRSSFFKGAYFHLNGLTCTYHRADARQYTLQQILRCPDIRRELRQQNLRLVHVWEDRK